MTDKTPKVAPGRPSGTSRGRAQELSTEDWQHVDTVIGKHRYPAKNRAIIALLRHGLRIGEVALLDVTDIADVSDDLTGYTLREWITVRAAITKGANALSSAEERQARQQMTISASQLQEILDDHGKRLAMGQNPSASDYFQPLKDRTPTTRKVPIAESAAAVLKQYLDWLLHEHREQGVFEPCPTALDGNGMARASIPLIVTQRGGRYNAAALTQHANNILQNWAGFPQSSTHSGRVSLLNDVVRTPGGLIQAQAIAGHRSGGTTMEYLRPRENELRDTIDNCL
ncbi:hypothetical protein A3709_20310 [Halioglobus sp. HI00S01]|uniref:site-specific integrase n=1 Tax=Halioglobus sp. HI00S01 TaxID=1822214 RepID=UPI0007C3F772|nr:site-specific integrase [Halioglobus sp. HI00S01]KZX57957.1 hypothetical protein A3709_20310 [Halioglobus sp. HI00S01]